LAVACSQLHASPVQQTAADYLACPVVGPITCVVIFELHQQVRLECFTLLLV
jgi:hypothetical protein